MLHGFIIINDAKIKGNFNYFCQISSVQFLNNVLRLEFAFAFFCSILNLEIYLTLCSFLEGTIYNCVPVCYRSW